MPDQATQTLTVYASIGNSDDKLTQQRWSGYLTRFTAEIRTLAVRVHGVWYSAPNDRYQNACVCFEIEEEAAPWMREALAKAAADFEQDSIAWAVVLGTEFIKPDPVAASEALAQENQ